MNPCVEFFVTAALDYFTPDNFSQKRAACKTQKPAPVFPARAFIQKNARHCWKSAFEIAMR
jgi:hypothetical protein